MRNESEATFFTRLVTVVIAIRAQYHSCCYQNRFTTITNTLALASPRILEDVSVLTSCYLHCEAPQHEIPKESSVDLAAGAMAIYCSRKDSDHPWQSGTGCTLIFLIGVLYSLVKPAIHCFRRLDTKNQTIRGCCPPFFQQTGNGFLRFPYSLSITPYN